jgi:predicted DsbA family dithiol-disulfide isomerase
MTRIEVFADIVCPFAHYGLQRVRAARERLGAHTAIRVRAWPLELINGRPLDADHAAASVSALRESVAPDLFRGFDPTTFPRTSLPAFGLVANAYAMNLATGEATSFGVREALFEHGLDVSDPDVLRGLADELDIGTGGIRAAEAVARADWERGRVRGAQGSPHFFIDGADWFCPSLDIRRRSGNYEIALAAERADAFAEAAFGPRHPEPAAR